MKAGWELVGRGRVFDGAKGRRRSRLTSGCGVLWYGVVDLDLNVGVGKGSVRQSETELEDWSLAKLVKCPVVNERTLEEVVLWCSVSVVWLVDDVGTVIATRSAKGERKLAGWVDTAVEDVCNTVAGLLAGNTRPDNGRNVGVVVP